MKLFFNITLSRQSMLTDIEEISANYFPKLIDFESSQYQYLVYNQMIDGYEPCPEIIGADPPRTKFNTVKNAITYLIENERILQYNREIREYNCIRFISSNWNYCTVYFADPNKIYDKPTLIYESESEIKYIKKVKL